LALRAQVRSAAGPVHGRQPVREYPTSGNDFGLPAVTPETTGYNVIRIFYIIKLKLDNIIYYISYLSF
jgi:hypothetical protein